MKKSKKGFWLFIAPALIAFTIVQIIPTFMGIGYSFTDWDGISKTKHFVGLSNYITILTNDLLFRKAFVFTLLFSVCAVISVNVIGFALAMLVTQKIKGSNFLRGVFFMPNLIGGILLGFTWQFIFVQVFEAIGKKLDIAWLQGWLTDQKTGFLGLLIVVTWQLSGYMMMIYIAQIQNILKGNISSVIDFMTRKMKEYTVSLQFEKAQEMKEAIEALKTHQTKSTIVSTSINDIDVFSYLEDEKYAYVNYLRIVHGAVNQVHTIELEKKLDELKESLLSFAIFEIRQLVNSRSREVLVPFYPDVLMEGMNYAIPQRGEKKQLLELSERNVKFFKMDRERQRGLRWQDSKLDLLNTIKNDLKLPRLPHRMECFDNSNIQGTNPVASCVVFIDGKPAKREYRRFHVKTVIGANDFASMEEILYRRYHRVLEEGGELPDLIVVDGGKGQLSSAVATLRKLDLLERVPIIGLAKQMEEIYYPGDKDPYLLAKTSVALKTLMHIRDEAHRFGITFHRKLREKKQTISVLSEIKGIGEKTEVSLLQYFKSVNAIKEASREELAKAIGPAKGNIVYDYFHSAVS